jgi:hypothetical protein
VPGGGGKSNGEMDGRSGELPSVAAVGATVTEFKLVGALDGNNHG